MTTKKGRRNLGSVVFVRNYSPRRESKGDSCRIYSMIPERVSLKNARTYRVVIRRVFLQKYRGANRARNENDAGSHDTVGLSN